MAALVVEALETITTTVIATITALAPTCLLPIKEVGIRPLPVPPRRSFSKPNGLTRSSALSHALIV
jgi:hypothetical protein